MMTRLSTPKGKTFTLMVCLLVGTAAANLGFAIRDFALHERYITEHPETVSIALASKNPGLCALLLTLAAVFLYRSKVGSWLVSVACLTVVILLYRTIYIVRVLGTDSSQLTPGKEWKGYYNFLKSSDSLYVYTTWEFLTLLAVAIVLIWEVAILLGNTLGMSRKTHHNDGH